MNNIEEGAFLTLFIRDGYVLDFSTNGFNIFTQKSIGVPLCLKYGKSKGKSLTAYCSEAKKDEAFKLLSDLFEYYEFYCKDKPGEEKFDNIYNKCKAIIERDSGYLHIETPAIKVVSRDYIRDISNRAIRDIDNGDYDSAITKSRTLLEEVFCHAIEVKNLIPSEKGDIRQLYAKVKDLYNMHAAEDTDKRIKTLLSGLEKIVTAVAEMRNKNSDAHGVGTKRKNISDYHARLVVNSALTMADFILAVINANRKKAGEQNRI